MDRWKAWCKCKNASRKAIWLSKSKSLGFFRKNSYGGRKADIVKAENYLYSKTNPQILFLVPQREYPRKVGQNRLKNLVQRYLRANKGVKKYIKDKNWSDISLSLGVPQFPLRAFTDSKLIPGQESDNKSNAFVSSTRLTGQNLEKTKFFWKERS